MKYMGSKSRFAKQLLPFLKSNNGFYYEPFAGGMNLIAKYDHEKTCRFANDSNQYLIAMFKALCDGWIPDDYYEKDYYNFIRQTMTAPDHVIGWLGFNCSYSGKWFGGFAGEVQTREGLRNYQAEAKRNVFKQIETMRDVIFTCHSYEQLSFIPGSTIYCDPPYQNTTGYKDDFDHEYFWQWVRNVSQKNNIFVSEYNAPDDFITVWSKQTKSSLSANGEIGGSKVSVEKLFVHESRHSHKIASVMDRA